MLTYKNGDLFTQYDLNPLPVKIIPHCCNDIGVWGAGFVVPLGKSFPKAKQDYQEYVEAMNKAPIDDELLGEVVYTKIPPKVIIANMIGQKGVGRQNGPPIRYWAIVKCMESVRKTAKIIQERGAKVEIHSPKFGSDLAGGRWELIEELINEIWSELNVTVYIYDK
jgi:hypothetical protein